MATVNFSVPDDVKKAFDRAFKNRNKSAVIADLMRRAVVDEERRKQRAELFRKLTERRRRRPSATSEQTQAARSVGRS
jgi:metal-responsive CopG/Arc/MetJ family transcriptional regulator